MGLPEDGGREETYLGSKPMRRDRCQENILKWQERVNEAEEAMIRRHREAAQEEMRQTYEEVDRKIGGEMLATGRSLYIG
jgi:hypothetical protein